MDRFIRRPTKKHLESIFAWCPSYEADRILWHNKPSIGGVLTMTDGQEATAYLYYRKLSRYSVRVEFIEVNEALRKNGIGTLLMDNAFRYFKDKGYKTVTIHCVTEAGEAHARKMGFIPYEPEDYSRDRRYETDFMMYHGLVEYQTAWPVIESDTIRFAVWRSSPSGSGAPDCCYDLDSELPIIDYIHYDWYVGIMKGRDLLRKEKLKRFFMKERDDIYDGIVYITPQEILDTIVQK